MVKQHKGVKGIYLCAQTLAHKPTALPPQQHFKSLCVEPNKLQKFMR